MLSFEDFKDMLKEHDIISLCETKLDNIDNKYISDKFDDIGFKVFIKTERTSQSGDLVAY